MLFFPKFHCELNAIERVWSFYQREVRDLNDGKIDTLRNILASVRPKMDLSLIRKYFRKTDDYVSAYRHDLHGKDIEAHVMMLRAKRYKSHRKVSDKQ